MILIKFKKHSLNNESITNNIDLNKEVYCVFLNNS